MTYERGEAAVFAKTSEVRHGRQRRLRRVLPRDEPSPAAPDVRHDRQPRRRPGVHPGGVRPGVATMEAGSRGGGPGGMGTYGRLADRCEQVAEDTKRNPCRHPPWSARPWPPAVARPRRIGLRAAEDSGGSATR